MFTVLLQFLWYRKVFPKKIYIALVPVVGGVALASISEVNFVLVGFLCALFASVLTGMLSAATMFCVNALPSFASNRGTFVGSIWIEETRSHQFSFVHFSHVIGLVIAVYFHF